MKNLQKCDLRLVFLFINFVRLEQNGVTLKKNETGRIGEEMAL